MTCRELVDFLAQYCDGELPHDLCEKFEAHLRECPPCVDYLQSYRITLQAEKIACVHTPAKPPCLPEDLIRAILASVSAPTPR